MVGNLPKKINIGFFEYIGLYAYINQVYTQKGDRKSFTPQKVIIFIESILVWISSFVLKNILNINKYIN